ncbi:MAG TPA: PQQ-binding-like beta-propeller repeat protein [Bryobacteraceae bacterium]|nr:PQQ-binding-like beta-propeller repeat protein [Bryobacteraceae bacterium]
MLPRSVLLCGILAASGVSSQTAMFRGNPAHTGVYDSKGPVNLDLKWRFKTQGKVRSSPAVAQGAVLFGSEDGHLYCLNAADGALRWSFSTEGDLSSSPAAADGAVFFTAADGRIYALDLETGKPRWVVKTGDARPWLYGRGKNRTWDYWLPSPAVAGDVLYTGALDGRVRAIDPRTGTVKWQFDTGSTVRATPAVAAGMVYIGDMNGRLHALAAATGAEKWRFETSLAGQPFGEIQSSAAVAGGAVFFGARDGYLRAVDAETGREKWSFSHAGSWVNTSPAVDAGVVYCGSSDGRFVQAVDAQSGKEKWRFAATDRVFSSPAVAGGKVYAATHGAAVVALDAATGKQLAQVETEGAVQSSPVIDDGVLYVGSDDSAFYAFGERPRKMRKAATIDAKLLDEYVGDYQVGAMRGTVKNQQGQLVLDLGPMGSVPLTPMSANGFFFDPADIEVEFQRDGSAGVSGFRFKQGDLELRWRRAPASAPK